MTYSNANFTPSLKGYSNVKPFRFWCQKVLPLVYDDSLSYYELLCKVVDYLNNVISDLSATEDNVGDLLTAYNQLQDYVNNYFTNLDVQEEINIKLDAMFDDGTIPTMIEEYLDPFIETLNENYAELDDQINETMDTQNENIATLTARVNNLVINNTTNLTGYNVVTVESTTAQGGSTVTENIPVSAEILQVCYSGYNDTNDTIKSDNISYESTPNTPSSTQQQVVVTITDVTDTRFNVFITYAVSQDIEIAELTDIRVGYDETVYPTAGDAVRGQVGDLTNGLIKTDKNVGIETISFTTGGYIATSGNISSSVNVDQPIESAGYAYFVDNCKYGDKYVLTAYGGGTPRLWAFVDKDNLLISSASGGAIGNNLVLTTPFTAKKLIVNTTLIMGAYSCKKLPSDYNPNYANNGISPIYFEPSYAINLNGTNVTMTIDETENVSFTKTRGFYFANAIIPCNVFGRIKVTGQLSSTYRLWGFVDKHGVILNKAESDETLTDYIFDIPKEAEYLILNVDTRYTFSATGYPKTDNYYKFQKGFIITSYVGSLINFTPSASQTLECIVIPCVKGQKFTITGETENNSAKRLYMFVDSDGYCRYREDVNLSLVGAEIEAPINGNLVVNVLANKSHSVNDNYKYAIRSPITNLPPAFIGAMSSKPMGALSKGYICMMTDDGYDNGIHGVVQETIPLAISKDVPFTFALMRDSDVCKDNTKLATVIDAIENHGCSVAQHSEFGWHNKTEDVLNTFFDLEKDFFESKGIDIHGAVIPAHYTTELVKAICGGRFGVVRSGYSGIVPGTQDQAGTVTNYYDYYTSGENSNLYCLSSYNCSGVTDSYNEEAVDYASANNTILICYFHEVDMTTEKWTIVSNLIDYAKTKGLEFITLGDIPYLINA